MNDDEITPMFQPHVARAIVNLIKLNANDKLADSKLIERSWSKKNASLGLFEMKELKLGKLLGTGTFSDVYEIEGFQPSNKVKHAPRTTATRQFFKDNATTKNGKSKYVVKHLRSKLAREPPTFCKAASDLCVEAQYLSVLTHENILKIRGWSTGGVDSYGKGSHSGYFLILDRLSETLADRLETWRNEKRNQSLDYSLQLLSLDNDNTAELLSRTRILHQVASALEYLHKKNIVFRDLKPDNVGFDENGTVKLFDFGLARELPKESTNVNEVYEMSGKSGTVRYMAPEVALSKNYNQKVDTYSWAMIYWSCLTLEKPYGDMGRSVHTQLVCRLGRRPQLSDEWPNSIHRVLKRAWAPDMYIRATMMEVSAWLERIEKELSGDLGSQIGRNNSILSRGSFAQQRSNSLISMAA